MEKVKDLPVYKTQSPLLPNNIKDMPCIEIDSYYVWLFDKDHKVIEKISRKHITGADAAEQLQTLAKELKIERK